MIFGVIPPDINSNSILIKPKISNIILTKRFVKEVVKLEGLLTLKTLEYLEISV